MKPLLLLLLALPVMAAPVSPDSARVVNLDTAWDSALLVLEYAGNYGTTTTTHRWYFNAAAQPDEKISFRSDEYRTHPDQDAGYVWWPIALIGLAMLLLTVIMFRSWRKNRCDERMYLPTDSYC